MEQFSQIKIKNTYDTPRPGWFWPPTPELGHPRLDCLKSQRITFDKIYVLLVTFNFVHV